MSGKYLYPTKSYLPYFIAMFKSIFITFKIHNDKVLVSNKFKLFAKVSPDEVTAYTAEKIDSLQILSSRLYKLEHDMVTF